MINWLINLNVPLAPPRHISGNFLTWVVTLMDEYRDIRLIWTIIEAVLMLTIAVLIFYFIYKVKSVEKCLKARFHALDERVQKITELHKRADEIEGKGGGE